MGTHGILHARRVSMAGECGVFEDAWRGLAADAGRSLGNLEW